MLEKWKKDRTVTPVSWVAMFFTLLGSVVYGIAFTGQGWAWTLEADSSGWGGQYRSQYSLWYVCSQMADGTGRQDCRVLEELPTIPEWWTGVQALAVLGLASGILSIVLLSIYICARTFNRKLWLISSACFVELFTGLALVGVFVFFCVEYLETAKYCCPELGHEVMEYSLSYCFVMCCAASLFHLCAWASALLEIFSIRAKRAEEMMYAKTRGYDMHMTSASTTSLNHRNNMPPLNQYY